MLSLLGSEDRIQTFLNARTFYQLSYTFIPSILHPNPLTHTVLRNLNGFQHLKIRRLGPGGGGTLP